MTSTRKLAAIMFTDIVGYTALMGEDEDAALQLLRKNRAIHKSIIARYQGEWLKEMGDGTLGSFNTSTDAVWCAVAIQSEAEKDGISLRIGIHVGEVVFEGNDVFGDGVNIASRIQELAPSGAMWLSASVHKNVLNKKGIETAFVKEAQLKNVSEPVRIYEVKVDRIEAVPITAKPSKTSQRKVLLTVAGVLAILALGYFGSSYFGSTPGADEQTIEKSIAVLPFKNMSTNEENQHFCDGIMNDIVNKLSIISDFRVPSRTSVEQFRDNPPSITKIAKELGVIFILEGSVQRIADSAIISVRLNDAQKDQRLWSDDYRRNLTDLFAVQAEVTEAIAGELQATISPEVKRRIEVQPTSDPLAYDYYLQGNEYLLQANSWTQSNSQWESALTQAQAFFRQAVIRDTFLAEAYLGMAMVEYEKQVQTAVLDENYLENVLNWVNRALEINPNLSDTYVLRSRYNIHKNKIDEAKKDIDKGLELNPNNVDILYANFDFNILYDIDYPNAIKTLKKIEERVSSEGELLDLCYKKAELFTQIGDVEMLEATFKQCQSINPDKPVRFEWIYNITGRYKENIDYINQYFPENQYKYVRLGGCYVYKRDYSTALEYFKKWEELVNVESADNWLSINDWHRYGQALVLSGDKERGLELLNRQIEINKSKIALDRQSGSTPMYDLAGIYAFKGEEETAFSWLDRFQAENGWLRSGYLSSFIQYDPQFDNIRDNQYFKDILARALEEQEAVQKQVRALYFLEEFKD